MIFTEMALPGAFILDLQRREDDRGYFARAFCRRELAEHGLSANVAQANLALSHRRGTVRGMHFQAPPAAESKLVRCTRGAVLDVIVDLRPESPSFLSSLAVELTSENGRALYVPERFAHGYQTLVDDSEVMYFAGEFYAPAAEGGLRFDDPRLQLAWPLPVSIVSERDRAFPLLAECEAALRQRLAVA